MNANRVRPGNIQAVRWTYAHLAPKDALVAKTVYPTLRAQVYRAKRVPLARLGRTRVWSHAWFVWPARTRRQTRQFATACWLAKHARLDFIAMIQRTRQHARLARQGDFNPMAQQKLAAEAAALRTLDRPAQSGELGSPVSKH